MTNGLESELVKVNPLVREHTIYKIGRERLPSVTALIALSNLDSKYQRLMGWQLKTVRAGLDPTAVSGDAATVGTLVHAMAEAHLTGTEVDYQFFSADQQRIADIAFTTFLGWLKENKIEPIAVEKPLTHLTYRYGGTIDIWARSGKRYLLCDLKSSTAVFLDHRIQLAAYSQLVTHRYKKPHDCMILHLSKETGQLTIHPFSDLKAEWEVFRTCLKLHDLQKRLK